MIYLLSQILLCLALAALLGGALGWLAHRARGSATLDALRRELAQRTRLLAEARGDVAMLSDDFEELRARSRDEIDALREENRRVPELAENLEKSQLMVRQLMQRHEAQARELNARNDELAERLALLQAQADLRERAHAELEAARLSERDARAPASDERDAAASEPDTVVADTDDAERPVRSPTTTARRGWASRTLGAAGTGSPDEAPDPFLGKPVGVPPARSAARSPAESHAEPFLDEVMEVDADLAAELRGDEGSVGSEDVADAPSAEPAAGDGTATTEFDDTAPFDVGVSDDMPSSPSDDAGNEAVHGGAADDALDPDDDEANATLAIDVEPSEIELAFDLDERDAPLFDPVDRQDDLQQLFGIGPVTEKALNALGITSYSQLAELERHEIEKIADALQIVPERIERDDWVGNARRQLEEVLEQL